MPKSIVLDTVALLAVLLLAQPSSSIAGSPVAPAGHGIDVQTCAWFDDFHISGPNGPVFASIVFDDGTGPALYVGGDFTTADRSATRGIARWDGNTWSAVGTGLAGDVFALAIYDDGSGPALYAGGLFYGIEPTTKANPPAIQSLAKWDGTTWSDPIRGDFFGTVHALAVFDDGSGSRLAVGGDFPDIGFLDAESIAVWDGTLWQNIGTGTNLGGVVSSLVADDGVLYAAGDFSSMDGVPITHLAAWDGSSWSPVGNAELDFLDLHQLVVYDDGGGPDLYAAGSRAMIGGAPIGNRVARWDGATWQAIGDGFGTDEPTALAVHDDGSGPVLMVSSFANDSGQAERAHHVASWDGTTWTDIGAGLSTGVYTMATYDSGSGPRLFVGGDYAEGDSFAPVVERQPDGSWEPVTAEPGGLGMDSAVRAFATFDDGSGSAVYAAGSFSAAGSAAIAGIARWRDGGWEAVGNGLLDADIQDLAIYDDGSGLALYAGGSFRLGPAEPVHHLARWDGITWTPIAGIDVTVSDLSVFDDGGGALLIADVVLPLRGAMVDRIRSWDGTTWTSFGVGIDDTIHDLAVFDDGSGSALYAVGAFTNAGAGAARHVARWNGTTWSAVGAGLPYPVEVATVYDDGSGAQLFVGGGDLSGGRLDAWDGTAWSVVFFPPGPETITALDTADLGDGRALYVGGSRSHLDLTTTAFLASRSPSGWSTLDFDGGEPARALTRFIAQNTTGLMVGGWSPSAGMPVSSRLAFSGQCTSSLLLADGFETGSLDAWVVGP